MAHFDSPEMVRALQAIEERNYRAAFDLLAPLAEASNPKAQCNLASLYHFGWGVEADGRKAVALYEKVVDQRIREEHLSALACHNLGTIYFTGAPGVDPDPEKGQQYSRMARELGFEM